jgi:hypothetical protein
VALPDDEPNAFAILLNIIHGLLSKAQRKVDIHLFARIAVLVDKYQMQEVSLLFSDIWFDDLKQQLPTEYNDDIVPWLTLCWVFRKLEQFTQITKLAQ